MYSVPFYSDYGSSDPSQFFNHGTIESRWNIGRQKLRGFNFTDSNSLLNFKSELVKFLTNQLWRRERKVCAKRNVRNGTIFNCVANGFVYSLIALGTVSKVGWNGWDSGRGPRKKRCRTRDENARRKKRGKRAVKKSPLTHEMPLGSAY